MARYIFCVCGRRVLSDPSAEGRYRLRRHMLGRGHPAYLGVRRKKRKATPCPESGRDVDVDPTQTFVIGEIQ
jgi:hypothetical protein